MQPSAQNDLVGSILLTSIVLTGGAILIGTCVKILSVLLG